MRRRYMCTDPVQTAGLKLLDITALRVKVQPGQRASGAHNVTHTQNGVGRNVGVNSGHGSENCRSGTQ